MRRIGLYLMLPALTACSGTDIYNKSLKDVNQILDDSALQMKKSRNISLFKNTDLVNRNKGIYLGHKEVQTFHGDPLPGRFESSNGVTLRTNIPMGLDNIIALIQDATKIPVEKNFKRSNVGAATNANVISDNLNKATGDTAERSGTNILNLIVNSSTGNMQMDIDYTGPLSAFLDKIALNYDLFWTYEHGRLVFSTEETKSFSISVLPSVYTTKNTISSDSSGSGSGSGSGSSSSSSDSQLDVSVSLDVWKDIEESIKLILGDEGTYTLSTSTSSVIVRTSAQNMKRVSEYIQKLNKQLERQVTIDVAVYSVSTSDVSNLSMSLQALLTRNGGVLGSITSNFPAASGTPTITGFLNGNGNSNNQVLLNLLATSGKVSVVTSAAVTTMSGQPVPLKVGNDRTYVSQIGTVMGQTSTTSSASTSSVTTGFLMNLLPSVGEDGNILLQYGITISSLVGSNDGFDQATVNGTIIQLPNVDSTTFVQSSLLKNGNTLILAGYEQKRNEISDSGLGKPGFKLLGGSRNGKDSREIKIISITPRIIDVKAGQ
ncbi:outer membrane lipoprotein BfpB [Escherichia coli 101-1]|uniref:secretin N-terminal domain-containing protein n=1 Tax=Escherichia coli TaxID=562 RepID=UPI00017A99CC|nr:secretin N-terminal domain-containing protein [Escherichia coli]EDX39157.1 outer membrane lipoprotein BfpB [Escherichia coli 101-1]EIX1602154.1 secretin N-terminal domain-containing protein [Escherichia coli]